MRRSPSVCALVVLLVGSSIGGCSGRSGGAAPARVDAGRPREGRPVVVTTPTPNPWPRSVVLHGQLEARESVQIAARVEGPVTAVRADLGDHVRSGAVLASISPTDYAAHVRQADADLAQARSDLTRLLSVDRPEAISRQAVEQSRTKVALAEAARELAARQLADATVRAPFAGSVARRYVSRGAFVRLGNPLFDFVSDGPMRLALEIPERFVHEIAEGTKITVLAEGDIQAGFEAEIVRVSPRIEQATRAFRVEASVDPRGGALRPGMFVLGHVALGFDQSAVRLPRSSVYSVLGHDRVTVVVDGKAVTKDVELLGEDRGDALVHGLSPTDTVVVRGGAMIAPGTPLRVEMAPPSTAGAPGGNAQ